MGRGHCALSGTASGCRRRYRPVAPSACGPLLTQLLEELMHFGRLLVNRRQRFGRKIVSLAPLGRGVMRRRDPVTLGLRDDALLYRLFPILEMGGAHLLGDIIGAG